MKRVTITLYDDQEPDHIIVVGYGYVRDDLGETIHGGLGEAVGNFSACLEEHFAWHAEQAAA